MESSSSQRAHPPETLEGWYALHQIFSVDRAALSVASTPRVDTTQVSPSSPDAGWTGVAKLIGSSADIMVIHFRQTLDAIGEAQDALRASPMMGALTPVYSFLSVTEAGLYHLTAQLAREAGERGGAVGDEQYVAEMAKRIAAEQGTPFMTRRLYPPLPVDMPYVCFYPMSKRRAPEQNWYSLSLDERSRLMQTHGRTGRRYAGRVQQVITGAVGFDAWEWGVTLFAKDPLDFKRLVTDMRFDEVSAKYADFGDFYVGRMTTWTEIGR
jgi:hydrogen peroxide-dependent heme synthase